MTTTKTLRLTFKNSENKKVSLSLPDAKENLTQEQVQAAMAGISQAGVFVRDGVELYREPESAAYIEHTVTDIFNHAAAAKNAGNAEAN